MTMTDPIADMLARLRNANSAYHDKVSMPSSSVKARIAEILKQEGFISGFHIESNPTGFGKTLVLDLKFGSNRERSIAGLRRVSKPGITCLCKINLTTKGFRWSWCCNYFNLLWFADR